MPLAVKTSHFLISSALIGALCAPVRAEDTYAARRKIQRDRLNAQREIAAKMHLTGGVDINSATRDQLKVLPGIGEIYAERIVNGRPYKLKAELVYRRILTEGQFKKIINLITVKPIIR